jgi:hypothetical protein
MPFTLLVLSFLVLAFQDVRNRQVWVILFPIICGLSLWYKWQTIQWEQVLWNLGFVLVCLLGLTLYLILKTKQLVLIWKGYFSWGDILFLVAITPLLWFPTYLVYFTLGTMLSLVIHTVILITQKKATKSVPYAGYMSLVLIGYLFIESKIVQLITNLQY